MLNEVHETHHFYGDDVVKNFTPDKPRKFMSVIRKELLLLKSSLPSGIFIRGFENAMVSLEVVVMMIIVMMVVERCDGVARDGDSDDKHPWLIVPDVILFIFNLS
jgi:hypothetical protein